MERQKDLTQLTFVFLDRWSVSCCLLKCAVLFINMVSVRSSCWYDMSDIMPAGILL